MRLRLLDFLNLELSTFDFRVYFTFTQPHATRARAERRTARTPNTRGATRAHTAITDQTHIHDRAHKERSRRIGAWHVSAMVSASASCVMSLRLPGEMSTLASWAVAVAVRHTAVSMLHGGLSFSLSLSFCFLSRGLRIGGTTDDDNRLLSVWAAGGGSPRCWNLNLFSGLGGCG